MVKGPEVTEEWPLGAEEASQVLASVHLCFLGFTDLSSSGGSACVGCPESRSWQFPGTCLCCLQGLSLSSADI